MSLNSGGKVGNDAVGQVGAGVVALAVEVVFGSRKAECETPVLEGIKVSFSSYKKLGIERGY